MPINISTIPKKKAATAKKSATKTVKKATTTAKKTVAQAETAVKKAAAPALSAVKVRTGTPDSTWSTAELKEYAKNKGLKGYTSLGKADLLALIKKSK
jgi:hypothetical protein